MSIVVGFGALTSARATQIHQSYSSGEAAFAIASVMPTINTQQAEDEGSPTSRPLILNGGLVSTTGGNEEPDYIARLNNNGSVLYAARVNTAEAGTGQFLIDPNADLVYTLKREADADNPESLYLRAIFDAQTLALKKQIAIRGLDLQTYSIEWITKSGEPDKIWLYNEEDADNGRVTVMQLSTESLDETPSALTPDWSFTLQDPSDSALGISLVRGDRDLVTWRSTAQINGSTREVSYEVAFSDDDGTIESAQRFHGAILDAAPLASTLPVRPNFTLSAPLERVKFVIRNELGFGGGTSSASILLWSSSSGLVWAGKIENVNLYPSVALGLLPDTVAFYGQKADGTPVFISLTPFVSGESPHNFETKVYESAVQLPLTQRGLFPDAAVRPLDGSDTVTLGNYESTAQGTLFDPLTGESNVLLFRYPANDLPMGELFEMQTNFPQSSRVYDFGDSRDLVILTSDTQGERFIVSELSYDLGTNPQCQVLEARPETPVDITAQLTVEDLADQDPYEVEENFSPPSTTTPDVLSGVTFSTTDAISLTEFPLQTNAVCLATAVPGSSASTFRVRGFTPEAGEVFTVRFPIEAGNQYSIEHTPSLDQAFRALSPPLQGASPGDWPFPSSSGIAEVPLDPDALSYESASPPAFDPNAEEFFIRIVEDPL